MAKLIRDLTSSYEDVLTIHAEGSLEAQKLSILALADFDRYKAAAKRAARIEDGVEHDLTVPSDKLKLVSSFDVLAGEETVLTLDFDAAESIKSTGAGEYKLQPTIKVVEE